MAWFKHEVGMFDDRKVKKLRRIIQVEHKIPGHVGYSLWNFLLEQIAKEGTICRLSPNYTLEDISIDFELEIEKVKIIVKVMAEISLIHKDLYEKCKVVCIPQFRDYYSEYTQRKSKESVGTKSGQGRDSVGVDRERDSKIEREIDNESLIKLSFNDPFLKEQMLKIGILPSHRK